VKIGKVYAGGDQGKAGGTAFLPCAYKAKYVVWL